MNLEWQKEMQASSIKQNFENHCRNIGVIFEGSFLDVNLQTTIINPSFQYDTKSRNLLLEAKDDERVYYWRSINNDNISLNNAQKNQLYELLKFTYFTKFAQSRQEIDNL